MNRITIESSVVPTWPVLFRLGAICTLAALLTATGSAQDKPGPAGRPPGAEGGNRPGRIAPITFDRAGTPVTLRQIGPAAWTDGTVKYKEESRDAEKILLSNPDGELVRIELEKKTVVFLGANKGTYNFIDRTAPKPAPTPAPEAKPAAAQVNGSSVTRVVATQKGKPITFSQTGKNQWSDGGTTYEETGRDEWSVYLSGPNDVTLQLDLYKKEAIFTGGRKGQFPITESSAERVKFAAAPKPAPKPVNPQPQPQPKPITPQPAPAPAPAPAPVSRINANGGNVTLAVFDRNGTRAEFRQTGPNDWTDGVSNYDEDRRDENSVYLSNTSRDAARIDLYIKAVVYSGNKSGQFTITEASANALPAPNIPREHETVKQILGYGYDATGVFGAESNKKRAIFDVSDPRNYEFSPISAETQIETRSGMSANSFSDELSVNVEGGGSSGLFSASVKVGVQTSKSGSSSTYFATVDDRTVFFTGRLKSSTKPIPQVLNDLNTGNPDQIIRTYGTHYANFAEFGGHMTFTTFVEQREFTTRQAIDTEVKASYGVANGSVGVGTANSATAQSMSQRGTFFSSGGSGNLNGTTQLNPQRYTNWKNSLRDRPGLAGFGNKNVRDGLRGIWTVKGLDANRARELKMAADRYIAQSKSGAFDVAGAKQVRRNSNFKLLGEDGRWLSGGVVSSGNSWYAQLGGGGQVHNFDSGGDVLNSGHVVKLLTANPDRNYPAYNKLMAPKTGNNCYYSYNTGDYENWKIWLNGKALQPNQPIYFEDKIVIENMAWQDRYLAPLGGPWLGVPSGQQYKWTIKE